jgi:hypothetical protein
MQSNPDSATISVAHEAEQFGIRGIVVSPCFFRTNVLDSGNVRYAESTIGDYASEASAEAVYSA